MITKTFEIRDAGTFIPVLAIKLHPSCEQDRYLFGRAGYGRNPDQQSEYVIVIRISGDLVKGSCDPYEHGSNTLTYAHQYIIEKFNDLESGAVVDVEYIRGITTEPKKSEASYI